jgi:hypothetical protein
MLYCALELQRTWCNQLKPEMQARNSVISSGNLPQCRTGLVACLRVSLADSLRDFALLGFETWSERELKGTNVL